MEPQEQIELLRAAGTVLVMLPVVAFAAFAFLRRVIA